MLKQRVMTALVLAPVVLAAIFYLPAVLLGFILTGVVLIANYELTQLSQWTGKSSQVITALLLLGAIGLILFVPVLQAYALYFATILWLLSTLWLFNPMAGSQAVTSWRLLKMGLSLVFLVATWVAVKTLHQWHPAWLIALLFLVWAADVGAYAAGKTLGRHKLAPKISPGKTWEGLVGGLITAILCMLLAAYIANDWPSPWWLLIPATVFIALVSVHGDLFISLLKRQTGVKDTGHIFPGHGGMMDRIDSLSAAAPFFTLAVESWHRYF